MQIGVSWIGIIIFVLPMLINIVYVFFPPVNATETTESVNQVIELVEKVSRMLYMVSICLLVDQREIVYRSVWLYVGVVFLVLYYLVWMRYFIGGRDVVLLTKSFCFIPIPLAVFPVLYFLCAAIWLHNIPAMIFMVIFGIAHFVVSLYSLKEK